MFTVRLPLPTEDHAGGTFWGPGVGLPWRLGLSPGLAAGHRVAAQPTELLATPLGKEKANFPLASHRPPCLTCSLPPRSTLST